MAPKESKGRPQDPQRPPKDTEKSIQTDTPKKPKLQMENRCKRHRDSDFTDATLEQHCVDNGLGPAECAERLNIAGNDWLVFHAGCKRQGLKYAERCF